MGRINKDDIVFINDFIVLVVVFLRFLEYEVRYNFSIDSRDNL